MFIKLRLVALCGMLLLPSALFAQDSTGTDAPEGVIYAYGVELSPPFEYEGIGGDTLFVNGYPYEPLRKVRRVPDNAPPPIVFTGPSEQHQLSTYAGKYARTHADSYEEQVRIFNDILRQHPKIALDVVDKPYGADVRWAYWPERYIPVEVSRDVEGAGWTREQHHEFLVRVIERCVVENDGFIVFGDDYMVWAGGDQGPTLKRWVASYVATGEVSGNSELSEYPADFRRELLEAQSDAHER